MIRNPRLAVFAAAGTGLILMLAAAQRPAALAQTSGGLWEVMGQGRSPARICVADTALLAQWEHRQASCTRVVIRDTPTWAEIHYTCSGGGFGRSKVTLITPRSLRIETQGIAGQTPFNYVVQARRVGGC